MQSVLAHYFASHTFVPLNTTTNMANIKYLISRRAEANGKSEITARIPINRNKYLQVSTGVYVTPSLFVIDGTSGGRSIGHVEIPKRGKLNFAQIDEAKRVTQELQDFTGRVQRILSVCDESTYKDRYTLAEALSATRMTNTADITQKSLNEALQAKWRRENASSLYELGEAFLYATGQAKRRADQFRVVLRLVHRWEAYRRDFLGESFKVDIHTLTTADLYDLKTYILNEAQYESEAPDFYQRIKAEYPVGTKHKARAIEPRGENTMIDIFKRLRALWAWMNDNGHTDNNPFERLKVGTARYGTPFYLTIDERNTLAEYDLSERPKLAIQRDIFVFHCLVGCRVGDLYKLTADNITDGVLEYVPHKTKDEAQSVKARVPLSERALRLIEAYRGADSKGRLFPYISEQKYNDAIKEALRLTGITRNVQVRNALTGETDTRPIYEVASSHMARRTFVGAAYSKVKDPNIVGKMSGHVEGSRAFARYRTIDDEALKEVITQIDTPQEPQQEQEDKATLLRLLANMTAEELKELLAKK